MRPQPAPDPAPPDPILPGSVLLGSVPPDAAPPGLGLPGHALPRLLDRVFAALADPTRRAILQVLLEDDMAVTDVASGFPVSLAAVSRHLQVLAEAGLIAQERRGRITWCKLLPDGLREASVWMAAFGLIEGVDLDAFERFLEGELGPREGISPRAGPEEACEALRRG